MEEKVVPITECCKKPALHRKSVNGKDYWYCENCWKQFSKDQVMITKGSGNEIPKANN